MADRFPMTLTGVQKLRDELLRLKTVERPEATRAIEEARAHGDLSENAEYHAARERQSFLEGRIKEVESKLSLAEVIDPSKLSGDRVVFGATVTVRDTESDDEKTYQIVGVDEADLKSGKISVTSPIARGMIGKRLGDEVIIRSPGGEKVYELLQVQFV
ncbi:MAG: transcription elongation factor GreA [Deltaproteobacteria bacterium]|nr:transcription elongation factor GreA [Deltaproteobacteria bacterium]